MNQTGSYLLILMVFCYFDALCFARTKCQLYYLHFELNMQQDQLLVSLWHAVFGLAASTQVHTNEPCCNCTAIICVISKAMVKSSLCLNWLTLC